MRHRLKAFLLCMSLFLLIPGRNCPAQTVVFDPKAYVQKLKDSANEKFNHAENIEQFVAIVKNGQANLQTLKAAYNTVNQYVKGASIVGDAIDNLQMVQNDIDLVSGVVSNLEAGGKMSVARARSYTNTLAYVALDVAGEMKFLYDEVLTEKNNMSSSERLEAFAEANAKYRNHHALLSMMLQDDLTDIRKRESAEFVSDAMRSAFSNGVTNNALGTPDPFSDEINDLVAEKNQEAIDNYSSGTGADVETVEEQLKSNNFNPYFYVTYIIIALLGAAYMVINWHRYNKGETQHRDALWKTFAGMLAAILILECLRTLFFGAGGILVG